jgi:hypothetical protein
MTITVGGNVLPITYPIEGSEIFWENFVGLFDGQATPIGSTLTIPTGKIFGVYQWNALAGSVASLPAANGTGNRVLCIVSVLRPDFVCCGGHIEYDYTEPDQHGLGQSRGVGGGN